MMNVAWDDSDAKWIISSFIAAAVIAVGVLVFFLRPAPAAAPPLAASTVIVSDGEGHGSGVHIGHGYILTAAHVVGTSATMEITDDRGTSQTGTVLWVNKAYDVALIQIVDASKIAVSRLDCSTRLAVGDDISAFGNPLNLQFIRTWGKVASTYAAREPWKLSFIANIAIAPGMSGGGVFDTAGNVVGLAVGIAVKPTGLGGAAPFAISYIVPSSAVCTLMARA